MSDATDILQTSAAGAYMQDDHITVPRDIWEKCQRVAARWEWLSDQAQMHSPHMGGRHSWRIPGSAIRTRGPTFDAAIDAAMKEPTP
jgi:hypothetical protein